jgi:hypothetical protein
MMRKTPVALMLSGNGQNLGHGDQCTTYFTTLEKFYQSNFGTGRLRRRTG